jgi:mannosyl-3-phosphoglycerate synthase
MRIDYPSSYTERIGAVSIHALQKIYELDSGEHPSRITSFPVPTPSTTTIAAPTTTLTPNSSSTLVSSTSSSCNHHHNQQQQHQEQPTRAYSYHALSKIFRELAIVIPVKNEKISLLEGVLSGIPNECLIIIVSNSERTPVDRFSMEVEMIKQYSLFANKNIMVIHQKDKDLARAFKKVKYTSILDSKKNYIRNGKAEGMIIGMLLAKMQLKKYVGFIDSDNYFPGAVNEYVKIFATGFAMSTTPYSNIRVSWASKPKIVNNQLKFPKWGRISETSNKYLNALISHITGIESDIITTGNAGEHALSMSLAENLNYSTGYSVEPYEFINILEEFGGLLDANANANASDIIEKGIEIFQIESRNPHFHEEKGADHLTGMMEDSLLAINNSKICNTELTKDIKNHLMMLQVKQNYDTSSKVSNYQSRKKHQRHRIMEPIKLIPMDEFAELVIKNSKTLTKI